MTQRAYQQEGSDGSRRLFAGAVLEGDGALIDVDGAGLSQALQERDRRGAAVWWVSENERVGTGEVADGAFDRRDDVLSSVVEADFLNVFYYVGGHRSVLLDELAGFTAAAERFDAQRAGAGVEIECSGEVRPECGKRIEEGAANEV